MTRYFFCCFFLVLGVGLSAQNIDKEAKAILDKMKSKYDAYSAVEIGFELNIEIPERAPEIQNGSIIQSGENYRIKLDQQEIYCDGESVWVHLIDNKEVQINDFEEDMSNEMMSPNDILAVYESGEYSYALTNEQREDGLIIQQIEFKPIDRDSEYSKMRLTLDKQKQQLVRIKIFAKDGSRFTMRVKTLKENKTYSLDTFRFDSTKHPDVHVEDLRL